MTTPTENKQIRSIQAAPGKFSIIIVALAILVSTLSVLPKGGGGIYCMDRFGSYCNPFPPSV